MGLLSDFIVANELDAIAYNGEEQGVPALHIVHSGRLTPLELETLYHVTQGGDPGDIVDYQFRTVNVVHDGEQVTTELSAALVGQLAEASDAALSAWANARARSEHFRGSDTNLRPLLDDLRRLAQLARAESKSMYLWICV
jgi:hypothetical protein